MREDADLAVKPVVAQGMRRARRELNFATMNQTSFADFEASARAAGFDTVLERRWPPDAVLDTHTHDFAVEALVTEGEMWLSHGGTTRHLRPGDRFALDAQVPHAERYGPQGAAFWVARRSMAPKAG